jgi:SAM-dependent methyltransferase
VGRRSITSTGSGQQQRFAFVRLLPDESEPIAEGGGWFGSHSPPLRHHGGMAGDYRVYTDLAEWWPLISPPEEYADEAAHLAGVFGSAAAGVRDVLDLGSGGGGVAVHLKDRLTMTLVDLSGEMLDVSRRLNPECEHIRGDMRTIRLGRTFDAVLVHDAIDYMTSEEDLRQVIETAFVHCRPGGLAVFVPDHVADTFQAVNGGGGGSDGTGRQASFTEWTWDPDPADDWVQAEYEFVLRGADATVHVVRETHRLGAFRRATWLRLLSGAGFGTVTAEASPAGLRGSLFVARRPGSEPGQPATCSASPHAGRSAQPGSLGRQPPAERRH